MYRLLPFIVIVPGLGLDDCDADGVAIEGIDVGSAVSVVPASSGSDGSCTFSAVDSLIPAGADDCVSAKKTICVSPSCVAAILALTAGFSCVTGNSTLSSEFRGHTAAHRATQAIMVIPRLFQCGYSTTKPTISNFLIKSSEKPAIFALSINIDKFFLAREQPT